jgi:two-component system, OmpR family, phosphate regulon sensor histidine kinase PhoR
VFKSLRTVLFLSFAGLAVISLAVFLAVAMPSIRFTIVSQVGKDSLDRARSAAPGFAADLKTGSSASILQRKAEEAARTSGNRITVIDSDGTVLADSQLKQKDIKQLDNHLNRPEVRSAQKSGFGISVRYSTTARKDLIYAAVPLKDSAGAAAGYIRFSAPLLYAGEIYSSLYSATGLAFFAALASALVLSFILSRWFFKPLKRLSWLSNEIVKGNFPKRSLHKPAFEFGEIERSVEQISEKLSEYFEKLSGEKGKLAGLLSNMREGVLAVDARGRVMFANRKICDMFGISDAGTTGLTVRTALRNNEIADAIEGALAAPGMYAEIEAELYSPVRSFFTVHAGPLSSDKGEFLGVICVFHDMTKIKELERYRSEFIANVSHELKTPLTVIRNYVETLLNGGIDDKANNKTFLQKIEQHTLNLNSLIEDIIELSRLERGREKKEAGRVDIAELAAKCVEVLSGKAAGKNIKIETKCGSCCVQGSREHLYRAMLNLADNAVKYTENGGAILIACKTDEQGTKVYVSDTGIGIPKESIPRIFERFYRVDPGRSRESGGTGLGLAIVKHIMELHGGTVSVVSEPGKGSVFTLEFPAQN